MQALRKTENTPDCRAVRTVLPDQIPRTVLDLWEDGELSEAAELFDDHFTFTDHALRLEFQQKNQLTDFFAKACELFPDFTVRTNAVFCCGDHVIHEWTFSATRTEPFLGGVLRKMPVSVVGISVVHIQNGKIRHWSDYYDRLNSWREALASYFTEWIEL